MIQAKIILLWTFTTCLFWSCSPELPEDVAVAMKELPNKLDYNRHVKPVLSDKCFACHGPDKAKQKGGLRLDLPEFALEMHSKNSGRAAIDPGDLADSEFFHRIISSDPEYIMPTPESHLSLTAREKAALIKWIEDGAEYKPHWAFVKPEKTDLPKISHSNLAVNPIDHFIFQKLEEENLHPSAQAEKALLLRRLSLDLTGLPPTLEETDAFLKDNASNAYEKQVDRLLASPHYGEKMAVDWLDLARFADSHGYTVDRLRDMSPYRDWVIGAFNKNMHYDQFIHWQLAGDLMAHPTRDMVIATAFNRNHQQNMEGGVIEEEFQAEYVVDRTNTFGDAFMGISVGCAKCHDHKYDPITQKNYYELFSFFNNVKEAGQISWNDALPTPTLMLPSPEQERMLRFINANIKIQEKKLSESQREAISGFSDWLKKGNHKLLAKQNIPHTGLQAQYTFDKGSLQNKANPKERGTMKRESGQAGGDPEFEKTADREALLLNGDVFLDLNQAGVFRKSEPFTIGIWVNVPANLKEGVILHKSQAERLYNFRGYHLYLKNDRLELNMAHTAPSNAITRVTTMPVPRNKWIQLTVTYDGSSKASGLKLYMDGAEAAMETTMDQLTKDILFKFSVEPGLQIGAWWRGLGFTGGKVDDIVVYNRALTPFETGILARKTNWSAITAKMTSQLSPTETAALRDYYLSAISPETNLARKNLQIARTAQADSTERIPELMVMQEMPKPKQTHILLRGNYDAPGEKVFPATPQSILAFPKNLPKNRYGLAQWLTHPDNPLTARVEVNRLWQNFFGAGIVKTTEDFGNQGEMPSHPELLDWLAVTFRESGWDIKKMNKLIVMSATYRQDSRTSKDVRDKDPENRLYARGPANRLSAEMIRDNALMASGLLNKKIGGKSVKPYQPDGLWSINNTSYDPDSGDAVYRRSLYVIVKRSVPNPTLATFDATTRSYCVVRRQKTNTPLQALVTLNDPTFIEAAKVMGEQMTRIADPRAAITVAYRRLTGKKPPSKELNLLVRLQKVEKEKFSKNPEKARGWLTSGQFKVTSKIDPAMVAANSVVASTILNSDASLTKR
ncbi:DUF1553 domain-containing protein [Dyadobacter pollutisoli]|uniref:DUF1553 domain-containing protein n=1 Tax=Dyadobacter pollutisoli TaxID=2910158 RepID=A0A9E8NF28_9BACT|nr:DUF1553 domain-containing protein [Dyadobacter pollutisoli]WAC13792.1 DUF1553 domain-containing protein [Dyadobacter pollutisoli]